MAKEISLNERFKSFVANCFDIYKGHNTAESQIGEKGNLNGDEQDCCLSMCAMFKIALVANCELQRTLKRKAAYLLCRWAKSFSIFATRLSTRAKPIQNYVIATCASCFINWVSHESWKTLTVSTMLYLYAYPISSNLVAHKNIHTSVGPKSPASVCNCVAPMARAGRSMFCILYGFRAYERLSKLRVTFNVVKVTNFQRDFLCTWSCPALLSPSMKVTSNGVFGVVHFCHCERQFKKTTFNFLCFCGRHSADSFRFPDVLSNLLSSLRNCRVLAAPKFM